MTRRTFLAQAAPLAALASTAPVTSDLRLTGLTGSTAVFSWRTNQPGDTQLEFEEVLDYGALKPGDYDTIVPGPELIYRNVQHDAMSKTFHEVRLTGLKPGTGYYVHVRSAAGEQFGPWQSWLFTTRVDVPALPPSGASLKDFLVGEAEKFAAAQRAEREKIRTIADLRAYQKGIRSAFLEAVGGLPTRTPLNARVVRTIDRGGYRIENVVFESLPNFLVPGNLYIQNS